MNAIILLSSVKLTVTVRSWEPALRVWLNPRTLGGQFISTAFPGCLKWTIMPFSLCLNVFFFLQKVIHMKLMVDLLQIVYFPAPSLFYYPAYIKTYFSHIDFPLTNKQNTAFQNPKKSKLTFFQIVVWKKKIPHTFPGLGQPGETPRVLKTYLFPCAWGLYILDGTMHSVPLSVRI